MKIPLTSRFNRLFIVLVIYSVILITFRQFDLVIFTEVGVYVEKVKKSFFNSHLSDSDHNRAFHLNDKFRFAHKTHATNDNYRDQV